jgi:hypothetical protein
MFTFLRSKVYLMSGFIYFLKDNDKLIPMEERTYDSELLLQSLLENYPTLLAGEQIDTVVPRKWVLISREKGVPDTAGGATRWFLDHLFLDQNAIPTLVEVKRSSNTQIRREIVGQMLEYAANAVSHWPPDSIRAQFEGQYEGPEEPEQALCEKLGLSEDVEEFWQRVKTNLQAGKIRMIFVADQIPPELKTIVEFLNEQMDPAEVIALEVRQYVGEEHKTLVPHIIGQTSKAIVKKSTASEKRQWDEQTYFEEIEQRQGPEVASIARRLLEWGNATSDHIWWGTGKTLGSFGPVVNATIDGTFYWYILIFVRTNGLVEIEFEVIRRRPPFESPKIRAELLRRIKEAIGINLPDDAINKYPTIDLHKLIDPEVFQKFIGALDWALQKIKAAAQD